MTFLGLKVRGLEADQVTDADRRLSAIMTDYWVVIDPRQARDALATYSSVEFL